MNARKTAHKPLGLFDFAPVSDGASALILTSASSAKKMTERPIDVLAIGSATDYLNYPKREDLSHFVAAEYAMKKASQTSKIKPSDLQILEVYDQSTVMEMVSLEDLGLCEPGTAWKSIHGCQNCYNIGGKQVYVNTDGGLKADGNPLGATGGAQIYEIYRQLRGEADERQVKVGDSSPQNGCVLEFEGFGTKAYVSILGVHKNE
jgi:acetyl-CoA C-acetyltransferase